MFHHSVSSVAYFRTWCGTHFYGLLDLIHTHRNHDDERDLCVYEWISITLKLDTIILAFHFFLLLLLLLLLSEFHYAREKWNRCEGFCIDFSQFFLNRLKKDYTSTYIHKKIIMNEAAALEMGKIQFDVNMLAVETCNDDIFVHRLVIIK